MKNFETRYMTKAGKRNHAKRGENRAKKGY